MAKWADYGIFRVKYDADRSAIVEVEACQDLGEAFAAAQKLSRASVVAAIRQGKTFVTVYFRSGKNQKGETVHPVTIDGVTYLRTTTNHVKRDNLGELPEYQ